MKKLSIKDKAKRYDEALKKIQKYVKDDYGCTRLRPEDIFPELAESEDEDILKGLISMCKTLGKTKWITWLEKQGEQKPANTDNKFIRICENKPKDISEFLDRLTTVEQEFLWEHIAKIREMDKEEQKPIIIPKFKVGDWIVRELDNTCYQIKKCILNVTTNKYGYDLTNDGYISSQDANFYHLWTIQDAKDGDVLCTYECGKPKIVFILKGAPEKPYVLGYHCFYNIMYPHFEFDSEKGCLAPNEENVKPATKEQRDTLMKAMADAGYTFDFEKKELKKIEQKPAWSEEDEEIHRKCICVMRASACGFPEEEDFVEQVDNWLKSIKDRVQPQPKQEWSERDKEEFQIAIDTLVEAGQHDSAHWLKSLRPQKQWKPSDEQIVALDGICSYIRNKADWEISQDMVSDLYKLSEQLKKLREE